MDDQPSRAVTVHRFAADAQAGDELAEQLTAFFRDRRADLPGLCEVVVLVGYGVGRVAAIAGWESREAQIAAVARLRADPELHAIAQKAGSGLVEHDEYRVVSREQM